MGGYLPTRTSSNNSDVCFKQWHAGQFAQLLGVQPTAVGEVGWYECARCIEQGRLPNSTL
jgi:hypothetical protein